MTGASGLGGWPGSEPLPAQQVALGELTDVPEGVTGLPFLSRSAGRGPAGSVLGRALSLLVDLPSEIGTHGWALADRPGRDLARAQAAAREDLDALAIAAHGHTGPIVVPVLGPLSLGAEVWLARGDRGVSDPGALRELAASLALGVAELVADVVRVVPGSRPSVLLIEPRLSDVIGGRVPTFSGRDLLRSVAAPVCVEHVGTVVRAARAAGAEQVVLHLGSDAALAGLASGAGADGFGLRPVGVAAWETVAGLVERGLRPWVQGSGLGAADLAQTVSVPWGRVGLAPSGLADVVLLAPDQADAPTPTEARRALTSVVGAARVLAERAAD
ncbi:MAG: hypothetical protein KJ548_10900 [Actinobacteria bacterium]|nr:hypothetical protein [Actinomycetota bacterium]